MLSACASSDGKSGVASAPDPVIETRTVTVVRCPSELLLDLAARPEPGPTAKLDGNEAGFAWLAALVARLGVLEDRLGDARKACP